MRTNIEKILVFQQSRVKDTISTSGKRSDPQNTKTKEVRNGEKARAFLLQPKDICTKKLKQFKEQRKLRTSSDGKRFPAEGRRSLTAKGQKTDCRKFKRTRA